MTAPAADAPRRFDRDEVIKPGVTVGELEDEYEGERFETVEDEPRWYCDMCSRGISFKREPRIIQQVCDDVLDEPEGHPREDLVRRIHRTRPFIQIASYCPECSTRRLLFPCEGFNEVHMAMTIDSDQRMRDVQIADISRADDGIPWDARELSQKVTTMPFDYMARQEGEKFLWSPEDMVVWFLSSVGDGIDIREIVQWDGSYDPKALGRARRKYREFNEKMLEDGYSRRKFRDHVRGDDR